MLTLLSWRQAYTACDLTCAEMHFVFSQAEIADVFSLERRPFREQHANLDYLIFHPGLIFCCLL